jgi:hypothetical protein
MLQIQGDKKWDKFSGKGKTTDPSKLLVAIRLERSKVGGTVVGRSPHAKRHVWGKGEGWFCASYGSLRRFAAGDPECKIVFYKLPRLGQHLSIFDESVALRACLDWLRELRFKQLEGDSEAGF